MLNKDITLPLAAGLVSSGLLLMVFGLGIDVFLFFPTLPILALGLSRQPQLALAAVFLAACVLGGSAGLPAAILYLFFLGLPSWYVARQSLRWRTGSDGQSREWQPLGLVFTHLTQWACAFVALMVVAYLGEPGGLPHILSQYIHEAFAKLKDEYGDVINQPSNQLAFMVQWSFLVFPLTIWLWALAIYGHAWLANHVLVRRKMAVRPDFAVEIFAMPNWMLPLLAIAALASLIGGDSMSFLGKATLLSLMLPYFFLGAAIIRKSSATWQSRRFFIFFICFMVLTQCWLALIISGIGLWHHIKRLSGTATSPKS